MMEKRWCTCLALGVALLAVASRAHAEDTPTFADRADDGVRDVDRAFGFMINPLAMALGVFGGEADFVLGRHAAVAVEGGLFLRRELTPAAVAATGVGLLVYVFDSELRGPYIEPHAIYAHPLNDAVGASDWAVADAVGLGGTAGWQWTWDYGFSVRVGAGAMYFFGFSNQSGKARIATGAQPVLDGSVGWAF